MINRRAFIKLFILFAAFALLAQFPVRYYLNRGVKFRTIGTEFQIYRNGKWQNFLIKGVNIGATKPGFFPGDMGTEKKDYLRWFRQIKKMNANSIRVYTILGPAFYEALFEYNLVALKPLYVFHGVWNNEEAISEQQDAYHPDIAEDYKNEIADLIDVVHGKKILPQRPGHASGAYIWDVAHYIAGYILGIEQDAGFVMSTNEKNPFITGYDGEYLYTENASPYECWLAEIGDYTIGYEYEKYGKQKPLSWTNWITTDPLWHYSDPDRYKEDAVSVDTEHILNKASFQPGLFASYHIYPYYPEFMMYDPEYTQFIDSRGKINPYEAYLRDIKSYHTVPLVVAEFGIPTSRGRTHENTLTGYNQGFVSEEKAGEYIADMFDSIIESGCAGGMIFSWQDEWFKRSWNTMDYDIPERRAFWPNAQVSEQNYGILAFDPGKRRDASYTDGNLSEWRMRKPLIKTSGFSMSVKNDEKYIYFMISDKNGNVETNKYAIAVGSFSATGSRSFNDENLRFNYPANHCIVINGRDNSAVYVDAYNDTFYRHYSRLSDLDIVEKNDAFEVKNNGIFNPIRLVLRRSLKFPLTDFILPPSVYETGRLLHGNSNPGSKEFSSLADFYINTDNQSIELRIPWQLLGVTDPSTRMVVGDMYEKEWFNINPSETKEFQLELFRINNDGTKEGGTGFYSWNTWDGVKYHERLKKSYRIVKANFAKY